METIVQDDIAAAFRSAMRLEQEFAIEDRMSFDDIPGWDSVGHMNLISELETRLGVALEMDEIVALDSVGAVRKLVARKRAGRRERSSTAAGRIAACACGRASPAAGNHRRGRNAQLWRSFPAGVVSRGTDRPVLGGRGERVVLCGPNSPQLAAAYFAVHAAGGVAVLLDADAPAEAVRAAVEDSEARLVLLDATQLATAGESPALAGGLPGRPAAVEDLAAITAMTAGPPLHSPRANLADAADLLYTTGTTGRRKGVLLTHDNIAQAAVNINAFVGAAAEDREIMPLPLSHSFGLGRLRVMALAGHCLLLMPGMRNPAALPQATARCPRHRAGPRARRLRFGPPHDRAIGWATPAGICATSKSAAPPCRPPRERSSWSCCPTRGSAITTA